VRCTVCATPLVAPGKVARVAFEWGLGAAMLVAVLAAIGWAAVCFLTATGAPWSLAVAGLLVGVAARAAARARGTPVQVAAGLALLVFFGLGEFLIMRHALLPRLEAMHAAEGAPDANIRAEQELVRIRREPERYASIEATRDLFLAMAAGIAVALWITRAPRAVAAFDAPVPPAPPTSSEPAPSSSPASPAPDPPAAGSSDSTR
jgi:hypothetical protein